MVNKISHQEVAVLGLLFEHQHYAYRLQEIMEKRGMESWADIDYFTLSATLKNLEMNGLIDSRIREKDFDENAKEVYYITDKGRKVLINEIKSMLSEKSEIFYPFNLALANIIVLNDDEIKKSLKTYLKSLENQINYLESSIKIQEENKLPHNFIAIYKRSLYLLSAEKDWIIKFIKKNDI